MELTLMAAIGCAIAGALLGMILDQRQVQLSKAQKAKAKEAERVKKVMQLLKSLE